MMEQLPASTTALALVRPVVQAAEAVAAWREFEGLKKALLGASDYQEVQGRVLVKKSGWRKLATAFGISTEVITERRLRDENDLLLVEVVVRAIAPNGRYAEAVGSCSAGERRFSHLEHDVRATAATRATNRAIADLIGGGEVSYEELSHEELGRPPRQRPGPAPPPARPAAPVEPAGPAGEQQLGAIRAHCRRTGVREDALLDEANVATLEQLTRSDAAGILRALQRLPNVVGATG